MSIAAKLGLMKLFGKSGRALIRTGLVWLKSLILDYFDPKLDRGSSNMKVDQNQLIMPEKYCP